MDEMIVIEAKHLSKAYKLYDKPVDRLKETLRPGNKSYHRDFYALHDVSFQVRKGETIGIIGRNGAGKSTLLKIITGVLSPSSGQVEVKGRISSLLELGAGFNPEFTGIENIYLNGTVMGYTREETTARIPVILEFADIGDFVYQPVKTYSSGMYVRLAFSVAINVEPDILIVDEALAVGDVKFQRKCFGRLADLKEKGMTILFVTHDLATTKKLCSVAMLLENGCLIGIGEPKNVAIQYFELLFPKAKLESGDSSLTDGAADRKSDLLVTEGITINPSAESANSFGMGGADFDGLTIIGSENMFFVGGDQVFADVRFHYDNDFIACLAEQEQVFDNIIVGVSISDVSGTYLFGMTNYDKGLLLTKEQRQDSEQTLRFSFQMPYLQSGDYVFNCALALGRQENHVQMKWYDGLAAFKMQSAKKYVYGVFYQEYDVISEGVIDEQ